VAARASGLKPRRLGLAAALLAAFLALGGAVDRWGPWAWDRGVQFGAPWLEAWRAITALGSFTSYVLLALALLTVGIAVPRVRRESVVTVAGLVLLWGIGDAMKLLFHRARPPGWHGTFETSFSYPSGHAELSLFFYGAIALWMVWPWARGAARIAGVTACAAVALAIAVSRVALGVHYLTDVLGGWLIAAAWLTAAGAFARSRSAAERGASRT